ERAALAGPAVTVQPMINLVPGYAVYAVPLVSVVILQAIMLMGITLALGGWLATEARPQHLEHALESPGTLAALVGGFALITFFWALYLEGFAFWWHDFPTLVKLPATLLVTVPLSLSIAALGVALALALGSGGYAMQVVVVSSVPAVFLSGAIYPWQNMPAWVQAIANLFPSTPGIHGMLLASQMGAPISAVMGPALHLMALALAYFAIAAWLARRHRMEPVPAA
ncbi:MAG: ABC transporter permease, partial [Burkholderiaceae bacterium]